MPYAAPFTRVTFGGSLAQGQEIWSCNIHLINTSGDTPEDWYETVRNYEDALAILIGEYIEDPITHVPTGVIMNYLRTTLVLADGSTSGEPSGVNVDYNGGGGDSYVPQAALVNTLVAPKFRDPGRYNRFYLPFTFSDTENLWCLDPAAQGAYANRLSELITDINTLVGGGLTPPTAMVGVVSNTASGSELPVVEVRLGRVIDTQRRRRNALSESYVSVDVA